MRPTAVLLMILVLALPVSGILPIARGQDSPEDGQNTPTSNERESERQESTYEFAYVGFDLAGILIGPSTSAGPTATMTGMVGNAHARSNATAAKVYELPTNRLVHETEVPALWPGDQHTFVFDYSPPPGRTSLRLEIEVVEGEMDATNNIAYAWIVGIGPLVEREAPVVFESARERRPTSLSYERRDSRLAVSISGRPEDASVLIAKDWLDSRIDSPAFQGSEFSLVSRDGTVFYELPSRFLHSRTEIVAEGFEGSTTATFGFGSASSVMLGDRPMWISREPSNPGSLRLRLDGESELGQAVWFNSTFLANVGITTPMFRHEDGTAIGSTRVGDYWFAQPQHFSAVIVEDAEAALFQASPGGAGLVGYEPSSPNNGFDGFFSIAGPGGIYRPFLPGKEYDVSAILESGGQSPVLSHPLQLTWLSSVATCPAGSNCGSLGFRLETSWCSECPHEPRLIGFAGTETVLDVDLDDVNAELEEDPVFYEFPPLKLSLSAVGTSTKWTVSLANGVIVKSTSRATSAVPLVNAVELRGFDDEVSRNTVYVDDIVINVDKGSYLSTLQGTGSDNVFTRLGSAVLTAADELQLTSTASNQAGRAVAMPSSAATKWSARFQFRIGPSPVGQDGLVFFFDKATEYSPASGGRLGFEDWGSSATGHTGYGIEFDGFRNVEFNDPSDSHVALIKDDVSQHLAAATLASMEDGLWHEAYLEVFEAKLCVFVDGKLLFCHTAATPLRLGRFGFSAATGDTADYHYVRDLEITTLPLNQAPNAPSAPSPASTSTNQPLDLTLSWTGGDPDSPYLYYTVLGFGGCIQITATACQVYRLQPSTTYSWQVAAFDGLLTTLGPIWTFTTTANQRPNVPSAPTPLDGATNVAPSVTLTWTGGDPDSASVYSYVEIGTSNPPGTVACTTYGNSCAVALLYGTSYYWTVTAYDTYSSSRGPVWSFRTGNPPLNPVPYQPTPADNEGDQRYDPLVSWFGGDVDRARYIVHWGTTTTMLTAACENISEKSCRLEGLVAGRTYYWRVTVTDISGARIFGPTWKFSVMPDHNPPFNPYAPTPEQEATSVPIVTMLSWQGGDPDGPEPVYTVYLDEQPSPTTIRCSAIHNRNCEVGPLLDNTKYYWRVVARDSAHVTAGPVWSFTSRLNSPPLTPSCPSPWPGSTNHAVDLWLDWCGGDPDGWATYTVLLGTDQSPSTVACRGVNIQGCHAPPLTYSTTYWWEVVVRDGASELRGGPWSFSTQVSPVNHPPNLPSEPTPWDGDVGIEPNPVLSWVGGDLDGTKPTYIVSWSYRNPNGDERWFGCTTTAESCATLIPAQREVVWQVSASDGASWAYSPWWKFNTYSLVGTGTETPGNAEACSDSGMLDEQGNIGTTDECAAAAGSCTSDDDDDDDDDRITFCLGTGKETPPDQYAGSNPNPRTESRGVDPVDVILTWEDKVVSSGTRYWVYLDETNPPTTLVCESVREKSCELRDYLLFDTEYFWRVLTSPASRSAAPDWSFTTASCSREWCPTEYEKAELRTGDAQADVPQEPAASNPYEGRTPAMQTWDSYQSVQRALGGGDTSSGCVVTRKSQACTALFIHGYIFPGNVDFQMVDTGYGGFFAALQRNYTNVRIVDYYGGICDTTSSAANSGPLIGPTAQSSHRYWMANEHTSPAGPSCKGPDREIHNRDTDIRHLAYHLAWYIYDEFSRFYDPSVPDSPGAIVDIYAHSMGGLLIRYAMYEVKLHQGQATDDDRLWPPKLYIENVVTIATPHAGITHKRYSWQWQDDACMAHDYRWFIPESWGDFYQARQMCGHSNFLKTVPRSYVPQGETGTRWALIAAESDEIVGAEKPTAIDANVAYRYWHDSGESPCKPFDRDGDWDHEDFLRLSADGSTDDSCFMWSDDGGARIYKFEADAPRPIRLAILEGRS